MSTNQPHVQITVPRNKHVSNLSSLLWLHRFLDETPGDAEHGGRPRQVPGVCWSRVTPTRPPSPQLRLWSTELAAELGLEHAEPEVLAGGPIVDGMVPYAQRYGGHQFGHWAHQLGDGRAITLGEVQTDAGVMELQLKGAGLTPYSRTADGKAVLRSSIREFLCSEAMHHLGVPTTRALSLVSTGEQVVRDVLYNGNPAPEPGAVVCRVAPSFIRFGSFQIHMADRNNDALRALVNHTIRHHFPSHHGDSDQGLIAWLTEVGERTATMIAHWMRVGFVHGVMNTDNMSIHGITIDYGPYGWLEPFNVDWTPNTTDSERRRYRFGQQAHIGSWNVARLLESMAPLMQDVGLLQPVLEHVTEFAMNLQSETWAAKLGLGDLQESDEELVNELLNLFGTDEVDMTLFFRLLIGLDEPSIKPLDEAFYDLATRDKTQWDTWLGHWWERVDGKPDLETMRSNNPKYVLRNWMAQMAIDAAQEGDDSVCNELHELLKRPYDEQPEMVDKWFQKRPEWAENRVGCSMLSCSS